MIPRARQLILACDTLRDEFTGDTRLEGEFSPGTVPSTIRALVPQCLARLRERAPILRIRVVPGLSVDIHEQVERGGVDAAILSQPAHVGPKLPLPLPGKERCLGLLSRVDVRKNMLIDVLFEELCGTVDQKPQNLAKPDF